MTDEEIREALGDLNWKMGREGRKWSQEEMLAKVNALPMRFEVMLGKLFGDEADRIRVLAALLEHVGLDQVLQLWRVAGDRSEELDAPGGQDLELADLKGRFGAPAKVVAIEDMSLGVASDPFPAHLGRASSDFGEELLGDGADQAEAATGVDPFWRTWNYRVMRFECEQEVHFALHEVHYKGGELLAFSESPAVVLWGEEEGIETAQAVLTRMQEAFAKPVLTPTDFEADEPPSDDDDDFRAWDKMPAVGRERFWLPAANRYPFKTLLALKRMKLGRAKRAIDPADLRAEKLARLKAFASGGQVPYRRPRFRARKI